MAVAKVIGTEIEYGVIVPNDPNFDPISVSLLLVNSYHGDPQRRLLWDYDQEEPFMDARGFEVDAEFEPPDDQSNMSINTTLTSGARYYLDHAHPEFSTPECTNARDIVRYEKAGERILETSRSRAESRFPGGQRIIVYKNNSGRKGNSYACHENYLMDRNTPFGEIVEHFMPFLVTRQIFCGAGKVDAENGTDPCTYQMSQRADFFETEVGLDTMIERPLINTRNEPHANRDRYRRLHVILGDSNMSEYSMYVRVGVTALVLQMIEDGFTTKDLSLQNPVKAVKDVSRDLSCKQPLELASGRKLSPVDVQLDYLALAHLYVAERGADADVRDVLQKWEYVLDSLVLVRRLLRRGVDSSTLCRGWVLSQPFLGACRSQWDMDARCCPPISHPGRPGAPPRSTPLTMAPTVTHTRGLPQLRPVGLVGTVPRRSICHRATGPRRSVCLCTGQSAMSSPRAPREHQPA